MDRERWRLQASFMLTLSPLTADSAKSSVGYCSTVPITAVRRKRFPVASFSRQRNSHTEGPFLLRTSEMTTLMSYRHFYPPVPAAQL